MSIKDIPNTVKDNFDENRSKITTKFLTQAGVIAAAYIVLTLISSLFGLASGVIQVRFSEILCILPCFTFAAVPGLFVGCLLSNIITGCVFWDVVFGSIATLLGAVGTYFLRKNRKYIASVPPILANIIIVPIIVCTAYSTGQGYFLVLLSVFLGEIITAGVLGQILYKALYPHRNIFR